MRSLGWALIQSDWCPYKQRKLGHRHTDALRGKTMWGPREKTTTSKPMTEASKLRGTLISNLWPPGLWQHTFLLFKSLICGICYNSPSRLIHTQLKHHPDPGTKHFRHPEKKCEFDCKDNWKSFLVLSMRFAKAIWNFRKISKVIGVSRVGWTGSKGSQNEWGRKKRQSRVQNLLLK